VDEQFTILSSLRQNRYLHSGCHNTVLNFRNFTIVPFPEKGR
jgi:hypothetical protein